MDKETGMKMNFHLKVYEGPLEFLYDLIKKEKIDIYDVPIFEITNQFLEYIEKAKEFDLELASEFILMAAQLLEIKSKYLLYTKEDEEIEEDPRIPLAKKLAVYKKFKNASGFLRDRASSSGEVFVRKKEEILVEEDFDLTAITVEMMLSSILSILKYEETEAKLIERTYKKKMYSIEEKADIMTKEISPEKEVLLSSFVYSLDVEETIVTFLCALELVRKGKARLYQEGFAMPIFIKGVDGYGE
jgi:segregation and condensation protein A